MKKTILATALALSLVNGFHDISVQIPTKKGLQPNLTSTEFKTFMMDVSKLTRSYSSGVCAKFTTALLDNLHERNEKAFPQLDLREGGIVQGRSGRQTYPITTSSNEILYAKNYKTVFQTRKDFEKISKNDVLNLPENTLVIAVYQPKSSARPGHIEVIFKRNNRLYAASDKLDKPMFFCNKLYKQVDFYYPIREDTQT